MGTEREVQGDGSMKGHIADERYRPIDDRHIAMMMAVLF